MDSQARTTGWRCRGVAETRKGFTTEGTEGTEKKGREKYDADERGYSESVWI